MPERDPTGPAQTGSGEGTTDPAADARLAAVLVRAPQPLADEQRTALRAICARHVELARRLRAVPLANADEPELVFVPFRGDGP